MKNSGNGGRQEETVNHLKSLQLEQVNVFSIPIFQMAVPALTPYHDEMLAMFEAKVSSGEIKRNTHGFGFQTPANLLDASTYPQPWFREILAPSFRAACLRILQGAFTDWEPNMKRRWVNTMTIAWAVLQTGDTVGDNPWHTHVPATLSGCYYVKLPDTAAEGNFQFMNPLVANIFQPRVGELRPKEGHMLIFPSFLNHRPALSPSMGNQMRLSLCLDAHFRAELVE